MTDDDVRLGEFTKEEWRDVVRLLCPEWTDEKFDLVWDEFARLKSRKSLH